MTSKVHQNSGTGIRLCRNVPNVAALIDRELLGSNMLAYYPTGHPVTFTLEPKLNLGTSYSAKMCLAILL